ncbi:MAG: hypothetical protein AVDCRST_MAG53-2329, partial [uncultured Solirubrobacteraceae bacterium]
AAMELRNRSTERGLLPRGGTGSRGITRRAPGRMLTAGCPKLVV